MVASTWRLTTSHTLCTPQLDSLSTANNNSPFVTLSKQESHHNASCSSHPTLDHVSASLPPLGFITIPRGQSVENIPQSAIVISPKTERILCTRDEDFRRWTWSEVKDVISQSRIDLFQRTPNDLARYVEFRHYLNRTFGSIISFIQKERLNWPSLKPSGAAPFQNSTDFKILYNDWPYGIDLDIIHLVVWTKFNFEEDEVTGDLTTRAHAGIENFVKKTFCNTRGGISRENLIWFRNGRSLKSVQALEHFHVMLYNPDREFLRRVTNGDIAMIDKLRNGKSA